ncbi:helix-turn-helix transcriptional regulator [Nostoc sp. CHAB 5834]|nr:helix-turn-helix transcriptional regulator [Nostoc sp. CHAB 5834]
MDIAKNIKNVRERKGIKQIDMASRMNLERSNYSRIENKGNDISIRQLQEIADAMDIPLIELIFPQEFKGVLKSKEIIPELIKENEELLDFKDKVETIFNFLTSFVPALEQMGFTEEKFKAQLDPEGKLEMYTKERLKELKNSLE